MKVIIVKESKINGLNLNIGEKVSHNQLGEGVIVGFSDITGEPFVFFYDRANKKDDRPMCLSHKELLSE